MPSSHVVSLLTQKYAKLLGEYQLAEQRIGPVVGLPAILNASQRVTDRKKEIDGLLDAIETVIHLYDPKWDAGDVSPVRARKKWKGGRGEIERLAYAVLHDNNNAPMKTREIARGVAKKLKIPGPDTPEINRLSSAIQNVLDRRVVDTVILHEGTPRRWSLKRFRSPDELPVTGVSNRRRAAVSKKP